MGRLKASAEGRHVAHPQDAAQEAHLPHQGPTGAPARHSRQVYLELPKNKKKKAAALEELCREFDVYKDYPSKLLKELKEQEQLPDRDGGGGAEIVISRWSRCRSTFIHCASTATYL
ncbi:hypothetical protein AB1Y20_014762 [Prymnesium parvum]|uniref:Nucleolar protein 16 n=1 Tax=Prymnesium parvum TaxID=97485 RepID=A0AB34ID11_PRYPA